MASPVALALTCPIPSRVSPHAEATQEWLDDWVHGFDLPLDASGLRKLAGGRFAHYASRLYPDASPADLRTLTGLFTWFFLVDDACDSADRLTPEQVRDLRDGVLRLLRGERYTRRDGFDGPLRLMLAEVWRVLRDWMPPAWRDRFADAVAHHLDGTLRESTNKSTGHRPGVAEYVELRRATSAAYVAHALVEFASGRPVPDPVYHHPLVRRISATGNDLLSWFNDLLSLERDTATAGGHNLVLAVAREHGVPVPVAVDLVGARWEESMAEFVALRGQVPSFGPVVDAALGAYLDGVANSVRGTIDWSLDSDRYRPDRTGSVSGAARAG
jgi:hypothetical protein